MVDPCIPVQDIIPENGKETVCPVRDELVITDNHKTNVFYYCSITVDCQGWSDYICNAKAGCIIELFHLFCNTGQELQEFAGLLPELKTLGLRFICNGHLSSPF
jgi:hypothetical protein